MNSFTVFLKKTIKKIFPFIFLTAVFFPEVSLAQKDTIPKDHRPRNATLLSTAVPGLGQVYNKKYWKVPVVYAGLITFGYFYRFNNHEYRTFTDAYLISIDPGATSFPFEEKYSSENLRELSDIYRRNRDMTAIGFALVYTLNIIDAYVDAHLMKFNVSDDLSFQMNLQPVMQPGMHLSAVPAAGFRMRF